jgi:hypothetical protein
MTDCANQIPLFVYLMGYAFAFLIFMFGLVVAKHAFFE